MKKTGLLICMLALSVQAYSQEIRQTTSDELINSPACKQAMRSYEIEAGSAKQNEAAIEMKRSAMYGACGMREPDKVDVKVDNRIDQRTQTQR